jgi:hypothetical protein
MVRRLDLLVAARGVALHREVDGAVAGVLEVEGMLVLYLLRVLASLLLVHLLLPLLLLRLRLRLQHQLPMLMPPRDGGTEFVCLKHEILALRRQSIEHDRRPYRGIHCIDYNTTCLGLVFVLHSLLHHQ